MTPRLSSHFSPFAMPASGARRNLLWLALMRFALLAGFWVFVSWAGSASAEPIETTGLGIGLLILVLLTLATLLRSGLEIAVSEQEFVAHLLLDIGGIGALLYFTGGATNPFVSWLLVPVTIAAAILPSRQAWFISLLAVSAYTVLLFYYQPLPALAPMHGMHHANASGLNLHVTGMWVTFTLSAFLITGFVTRMASGLRERELQMQQQQERDRQDEQLLSLASLAASTTHELGTPLSTIKLLASEMRHTPASAAEIETLVSQVEVCQDTLHKLSHLADHASDHSTTETELRRWVEQVIEQWQLLHPASPWHLDFKAPDTMPINPPDGLRHSVINLLVNAARKSKQALEITIQCVEGDLRVEIRDYGAPVSQQAMERLGKSFIGTRGEGLGLGLFLTHATVRQYGGELRMYNLADGVKSVLIIPLERLSV